MSAFDRRDRLPLLRPWTWPEALRDGAIANARAAATECHRRRVERDDVALYLQARATSSQAARHPA